MITNDQKADVTFIKRASSRKQTSDNINFQNSNNNNKNDLKNQIFKVANNNDSAKEKEK